MKRMLFLVNECFYTAVPVPSRASAQALADAALRQSGTALRQAALSVLQSQTADQDEEEACDKGNDDLSDHDVKISFLMGHFANAQQSDLRALMRQGIQCARSDGSDPVDLLQVGTEFNISIFEGVKRNAHTA